MDPQNRRTASSYINNLLLSRGLLRTGDPIDFATPGNAEGGVDGTMGQVMTLLHDLILRRDVSRPSLKLGSWYNVLIYHRSESQTHWLASLKTYRRFAPPQPSRHRVSHVWEIVLQT